MIIMKSYMIQQPMCLITGSPLTNKREGAWEKDADIPHYKSTKVQPKKVKMGLYSPLEQFDPALPINNTKRPLKMSAGRGRDKSAPPTGNCFRQGAST